MSKKSCFLGSILYGKVGNRYEVTVCPSGSVENYVLNEDLPTEWFAIMNQRLRRLIQ